ncbi:hypothetical protein PHET_11155 [Paragonimus heterotremus]|uniref:Uncharacterized protein n=1 Tax=Paragonimus heterotremus TaxID=100268 RepID=A0A8J4SNC4_9TREM|nr:hypothetical protein PHET_11155 [Paragonimus heterotremus]
MMIASLVVVLSCLALGSANAAIDTLDTGKRYLTTTDVAALLKKDVSDACTFVFGHPSTPVYLFHPVEPYYVEAPTDYLKDLI